MLGPAGPGTGWVSGLTFIECFLEKDMRLELKAGGRGCETTGRELCVRAP